MTEPLPGKVLIVRLGAIGDVVNALVLATAIKESEPATRIGWVAHELAAPLVVGHPAVDDVYLWRRSSGLRGFLAVAKRIRAERFELAVDLQRLAKSALLARLSGAPRVLGFDRARAKEASWLLTRERIPPSDPGAHMVEQYLELARHLGVGSGRAVHRFPPDEEAEAWADELVQELGAAPIVVNLGASKPANRWPPERFGDLAAACRRESGSPVCLTGGPGDAHLARRALAAAGRVDGVRDLVGATSLRQLVALEARARLFVGCDTGPLHIAAACGTPVVALFGAADPRRTGPYDWGDAGDGGGAGHRVVRVLPPCAPCNRRHCHQPRHACMEDITVRHVMDAVRRTIEARSPQVAIGP